MPGSCDGEQNTPSLISSLRSYRRSRPKQSQSLADSSSSNSNSNCQTTLIGGSVDGNLDFAHNLPASDSLTSVSKVCPDSAATVNYNPLSYRKYEISHTSQFILPCVLTKIQQTCRKNKAAVIDLPLDLTEEEYLKLKELVLKEGTLGEKWKSNVIETTSYITCGFRELKVNRSYISELAKGIRSIINNTCISDKTVNSTLSTTSPQLNKSKPLRTYSRTPKTSSPNPQKAPPKVIQESVSSTTVSENRASPTKEIMDEYEVFCGKELNLRKLLDAFPGADIMEAQDILVRCNWNLDEAVKTAHAQPLRCSKKKALSQASSISLESTDLSQNHETHNIEPSISSENMSTNISEEIVLDSSDDEFNESLKKMNSNKRRLSSDGPQAAKRVRKVISSSESEGESSCSSNQTSSLSDVTSKTSSNVSLEKAFSSSSSLTIKPISNSSINSVQSKQAPPSANSIPNLPKGLVITQLGSSSTTKLVSDVDTSTKSTNSGSVSMTNHKAEVITIPSESLSKSSTSQNPNKSAQLVRIQSANNGTTTPKPNLGYTIYPVNSVVSASSKEGTSSSSNNSSADNSVKVVTIRKDNSSGLKSKHAKVKHKKVVVSDDEDDDYGNEDVYDSEDSDIEVNLTSAHSAVLRFLQEASVDELSSIPGCSKKKVEAILALKPFTSWMDLVGYFFMNELNNSRV